MMVWGYGMSLGGWLMMGGLWLILVIAAVGSVMWIFPRDARGPGRAITDRADFRARPAADSLGMLADRLARGEIDIQTYRELRAELTGTDRATR